MSDDQFRLLVESIVRDVLAKQPTAANDEYLSTDEAAEVAHVTSGTIRRWVREKKLKRYSAGAHIRVRRSEIDRLLLGPVVETPAERALKKFAAK